MLNKEVCKECHERCTSRGWTDTKEVGWEERRSVWCVGLWRNRGRHLGYRVRVSVRAKPPAVCLYAVEQAVSQ